MPNTSWKVQTNYIEQLKAERSLGLIPESIQAPSTLSGLFERARKGPRGQPWDTILRTCCHFGWNILELIDFQIEPLTPIRVKQLRAHFKELSLPAGKHTWEEAICGVNSAEWRELLSSWLLSDKDTQCGVGTNTTNESHVSCCPAETDMLQFGDLDRVGTGPVELFRGRIDELRLLDLALQDSNTKVVVVHALAGIGKTALMKHWTASLLSREHSGIDSAFGYSFYDQGQINGTADSDPFFKNALASFGDTAPTNGTPYDRVVRLTRLLNNRKCLLIIDGIEVLQYAPTQGHTNDITNQQFREFIYRLLVGSFSGLVILTTRYLPSFLKNRPGVITVELSSLDVGTGVAVLRALGVKDYVDIDGKSALENAVIENDGHALSIVMIGSYLAEECSGDPRRRHEIPELPELGDFGRHAHKVLAHYESLFRESKGCEIVSLYLLSIFDRPTLYEHFESLFIHCCQSYTSIAHSVSTAESRRVVKRLVRLGVLTVTVTADCEYLDLHPIVRSYFRSRFKTHDEKLWRDANHFLFDACIATAPKSLSAIVSLPQAAAAYELQQTLAIQQLTDAVRHGCAADRIWDALAVIACRVDESIQSRHERGLRWLLNLWGHLSRWHTLEHLLIMILRVLGRLGVPPLARFYREDFDMHAVVGFYLGSQLQGWDARLMIALPFYPSRDCRNEPLLRDRFFSAFHDIATAFCASSVGQGDLSFELAMRASKKLRGLGIRQLECIPVVGAAITRMLSGDFALSEKLSREVFDSAITTQMRANALGLLAGCFSRQGNYQAAEDSFRNAFSLSGALSTRIAQIHWEHVCRYSPIGDAAQILDEAEGNIPGHNVSASDVNYRTHLAICRMELRFRQAYESKQVASKDLTEELSRMFATVPNYHFEGAAFRTESVLLHARVLTWHAEHCDQSEPAIDVALTEVATTERLARSFGYRPYLADALMLRSRLLDLSGRHDSARNLMAEATAICDSTGYRWGIDELVRIRNVKK